VASTFVLDLPEGLVGRAMLRHPVWNTPDATPEAHMSMPQSEETHQSLLARIPEVTGRDLPSWLECLSNGPGLLRFEARVNWLADEHDLPHGYARAIVHEHDKRRAAVRAQPAAS